VSEIQPDCVSRVGVPLCSLECPSHDGKRCRLTGFRPNSICEPYVKNLLPLARFGARCLEACATREHIHEEGERLGLLLKCHCPDEDHGYHYPPEVAALVKSLAEKT
jgi:hypothetical protein